MHQTYAEYMEEDANACEQRRSLLMLQELTLAGIKTGVIRTNKQEISVRRIYSKLFPSAHYASSQVALHRMKLYLQDGMEKEAVDQLKHVFSISDTSICEILNHCFLLALAGRMSAVIRAFFARGFPQSVNARIYGGRSSSMFPTYFHLALASQNLSIIMLFFRRTIDYQETWHGLGPVHLAAVNSDIRVLDMLLSYGANPMEYTTTAHYELMQSILKKEPPKGWLRDARPIYPIDLAAAAGNWGALLLLMRKAPKSVEHSQHLLHILSSLEMSVKAINIGARVESSLADFSTLLHTKAIEQRPEMLAFYLALGVPADARDRRGRTALGLALERNHRESIWVLMQHGATVPPEYLEHATVRDIRAGKLRPSPDALERLEYYRAAAEHAVPAKPRKKSRFSISRLLLNGERSLKSTILGTNAKIEKTRRLAQPVPEDPRESRIKFCQVLSGKGGKGLHKSH